MVEVTGPCGKYVDPALYDSLAGRLDDLSASVGKLADKMDAHNTSHLAAAEAKLQRYMWDAKSTIQAAASVMAMLAALAAFLAPLVHR